MTDRYFSFNRYAAERFGQKVYKLALSGGMTCPNRDGTLSYGGCIFCSDGGSGDFAEPMCESVSTQIDKAKKQVASKMTEGKYIAYFQSYTNTYAPAEYLKKLFGEALSHPDVVALSVATRPDCLPDEIVSLLGELNCIKPVFVELGLQTADDEIARLINRGYSLPVYDNAVKRLKRAGINVVTHLILGLPEESPYSMLRGVIHAAECGSDGVKLQLLHVLKNTPMEKLYLSGQYECLSRERYIEILGDAINILPENIVIHRITGDAPKKLLVAPLWSADKKAVLNAVYRSFEQRNVIQGSLYGKTEKVLTNYSPAQQKR